jgi:acetyl esterase/lipase
MMVHFDVLAQRLGQSVTALLLIGGVVVGTTPIAPAAPLENLQEIPMWPNDPPGSAQFPAPQEILERSKDPAVRDRAVLAITNPELLVYRPERPNGTALLVTPGGAYQRVVIDKEAEEIAPRFTQSGVTVFRLVYRLPGRAQATDAPLMDAQRAMRLIRANAAEWGLDSARIGILGFSAGGHLAAQLANGFDRQTYAPVDDADRLSARPDFLALGYPVITMDEAFTHATSRRELIGETPSTEVITAYSNEQHVTRNTPQAFLFHADDDADVPVTNSLVFYQALRRAGVPTEMHIFRQGGHGFSLRFAVGLPAAQWPDLMLNWMRSIKMLP